MRVLALDIGEKRLGIAVSDPAGRVATPVRVMDATALRDPAKIASLVADFDAELVLIGLPVSLDGSEGPQARRVRAIGARLAQGLRVEVRYADERMSSKEARRVLTDAGVSEREQRGRVDMLAATMFLQSFLDAHVPADEDERSVDGR